MNDKKKTDDNDKALVADVVGEVELSDEELDSAVGGARLQTATAIARNTKSSAAPICHTSVCCAIKL